MRAARRAVEATTDRRSGSTTDRPGWTGQWVADRLDVVVETTPSPLGISVEDLVGLALRRNPRRAHLLVSRVLGKHVPADPRLVYGAGLFLGELVRAHLNGNNAATTGTAALTDRLRTALSEDHPDRAATTAWLPAAVAAHRPPADRNPPAVVLGYAETATALGHTVAEALQTAAYLHSTRRAVAGIEPVGGFAEEHSHAAAHLLLPRNPAMLLNALPLVLVDDEVSTGTTVLNTIDLLHRLHPREQYVIATLVDARSSHDRMRMAAAAAALGTRIDVVAMASGRITLADNAPQRGQDLVAALDSASASSPNRTTITRATVARVDVRWPPAVPVTGRHGFLPAHRDRLNAALEAMADTLAEALRPARSLDCRVLVIGVEELMYAPLRLAVTLADRFDSDGPVGAGSQVHYATTTRSPVLAVDDPGYAIRDGITFLATDRAADRPDDGGVRFAYNLMPRGADDARRTTVVLVLDCDADTDVLFRPGGLIDALTAVAHRILLVTLGGRE